MTEAHPKRKPGIVWQKISLREQFHFVTSVLSQTQALSLSIDVFYLFRFIGWALPHGFLYKKRSKLPCNKTTPFNKCLPCQDVCPEDDGSVGSGRIEVVTRVLGALQGSGVATEHSVDDQMSVMRDVKQESSLAWGAKRLIGWHGQHFRNKFEPNECTAPAARLRLHAAAEWTMQMQMQELSCILKLVDTMQQCEAWKGICFIEHTLYDETPLQLVVRYTHEESAQKETSKTWVIELQWSMGIEILGSVDNNRKREYVQLQGRFSPSLRATASGDGESIAQVLRAVPRPEPGLISKIFRHRVRHTECDKHPAHPRGETLLAQDHPAAPYTPLHGPCFAHKVHSSVTKSWALPAEAPTVQGVVHTGKYLSTAGCMKKLKDAVGELVKQRLQILVLPVDDPVRSQIVNHCLPPLTHPRRRAVALACSTFFNGHWSKAGVLQHVCPGPACCESRDASLATATRLLKKTLSCLFGNVLSKANWAEWSSNLLWYLWGDSLNHIAVDAFHLAFTRVANQNADLEVLMGESEAVDNVGLFEEERVQELVSEDMNLRQRVENAKSLKIALAFHGTWSVEISFF